MRKAPLALLLVWAAPAGADVAVPLPAPTTPTWKDACAARIDGAARTLRMSEHARLDLTVLRSESGAPNPVRSVDYSELVGPSSLTVSVGDDSDGRGDKAWARTRAGESRFFRLFRRARGRYALLETDRTEWVAPFKAALDDCLKMGESK